MKKCPKCGSNDFYEYNLERNDYRIWFQCTCKNCRYRFETHYLFSEIKEVENEVG